MSIVDSNGPPSWSLDVSETGESTKCLWVGVMGLLPTGILYSPQFRSHQETKMAARRTQLSTSTIYGKIGDCEQSNYHANGHTLGFQSQV